MKKIALEDGKAGDVEAEVQDQLQAATAKTVIEELVSCGKKILKSNALFCNIKDNLFNLQNTYYFKNIVKMQILLPLVLIYRTLVILHLKSLIMI